MSFLRNILITILATTLFFDAEAGHLVNYQFSDEVADSTDEFLRNETFTNLHMNRGAPRNERFTSNGKDIVTSEDTIIPPSLRGSCVGKPGEGKDCVDIYLRILRAVEMPTVSDRDLIKGLQDELKSNRDLQIDWYTAAGLLIEKKKKGGEWARVEEYDVALITFGLTNFYGEFNVACRNLKNVREASSFKYRNFYNLLLRGIRDCKGEPLKISKTDKVYRGCSIKPTDLPIKEKDTFLFKQFASTSLNMDTAAAFSSGGSLFVIDGINQGSVGSQRVLGLGKHSTFEYEKEVILNPFEVYTITKIEQEAGKRYATVHLTANP